MAPYSARRLSLRPVSCQYRGHLGNEGPGPRPVLHSYCSGEAVSERLRGRWLELSCRLVCDSEGLRILPDAQKIDVRQFVSSSDRTSLASPTLSATSERFTSSNSRSTRPSSRSSLSGAEKPIWKSADSGFVLRRRRNNPDVRDASQNIGGYEFSNRPAEDIDGRMRQYNYLQQTRDMDRSDRSGGGCDLDWAERGRADEL